MNIAYSRFNKKVIVKGYKILYVFNKTEVNKLWKEACALTEHIREDFLKNSPSNFYSKEQLENLELPSDSDGMIYAAKGIWQNLCYNLRMAKVRESGHVSIRKLYSTQLNLEQSLPLSLVKTIDDSEQLKINIGRKARGSRVVYIPALDQWCAIAAATKDSRKTKRVTKVTATELNDMISENLIDLLIVDLAS